MCVGRPVDEVLDPRGALSARRPPHFSGRPGLRPSVPCRLGLRPRCVGRPRNDLPFRDTSAAGPNRAKLGCPPGTWRGRERMIDTFPMLLLCARLNGVTDFSHFDGDGFPFTLDRAVGAAPISSLEPRVPIFSESLYLRISRPMRPPPGRDCAAAPLASISAFQCIRVNTSSRFVLARGAGASVWVRPLCLTRPDGEPRQRRQITPPRPG